MITRPRLFPLSLLCLALACQSGAQPDKPTKSAPVADSKTPEAPPEATRGFEHRTEQFADNQILRYEVPGFEQLSTEKKLLLYYLYEAALSGRDIIYDQKYRYNLTIRHTLEAIWRSFKGDRNADDYRHFITYTKQVWFARGIHHDYSGIKYKPEFSQEFFATAVRGSDQTLLPLREGETVDQLIERLTPLLFDPTIDAKRVNRADGVDKVKTSAVNFYEGVTEQEVLAFYSERSKGDGPTPVSHGLNSKLVKENGKLVEKVWRADGMYGAAIQEIIKWLEKAVAVAETPEQKQALELLIKYYQTGDLKTFDDYSIAWAKDNKSQTDVVNGFIEVYNDPLGFRGTFESVVSFKDPEASKRIATIGDQAQWFEDHSPIDKAHKKENVVGISAKVITVVVESGDAAPTTPIGINLPNANWIRQNHGSKSVNLGNIVAAYDESRRHSGLLEEFASTPDEITRAKAHGSLSSKLKVDMHEVIGHASGKLLPGVKTPKETLKSYASALEEGRADLVALYFMMDQKLIDLGLMSSLDVGKAAYDGYIRNGLLVQLARLELGEDIEESHMRNRQTVAAWAYEKGKADKVIERIDRDGKTYFRINDYQKLRELFGQLLAEIQRIKSTGDYEAGKALIETYGVKVDPKIHAQVLERYKKLGISPYSGFIQPRLVPVKSGDEITDIKIEYPTDFAGQQLEYSEHYGFLPVEN